MAINPSTNPEYSGQTAIPDVDYPYGSAKNDLLPGDLTGTPRVATEINDIFGLQQKLLSEAGITPNGSPDTVQNSQYFDALTSVFDRYVNDIAELRDQPTGIPGRKISVKYHTNQIAGGGGDFIESTVEIPGTYVEDNGYTILPTATPDGSIAFLRNKPKEIAFPIDFGALEDNTTDDITALNAARDLSGARQISITRSLAISVPFVMNIEGQHLHGVSRWSSAIVQAPGFAGVASIDVNGARLQTISDLFVAGNAAVNSSDAIRVTDGQLLTLRSLVVKTGVAGVRLIKGNSQRWFDIYAEGNDTGFLVIPDVLDDTNGCIMLGCRSFTHTVWGLDVQAGAGPNGHMNSTWDISCEGGSGAGVRIRAGRYCSYTLYSESNTGDEFDLDNTVPNHYFIRNPDNDDDGALGRADFLGMGVKTLGLNMYFDEGIAPERYAEQVFAASGSLAQQGVKMFDVTNTSGSTRTMTLSFLSYLPAGHRATITKRDSTAGFTLAAPGGQTITGDTGTFGAFPTSVKMLEVMKISATISVLIQTGA